jgi:hypothetical protein
LSNGTKIDLAYNSTFDGILVMTYLSHANLHQKYLEKIDLIVPSYFDPNNGVKMSKGEITFYKFGIPGVSIDIFKLYLRRKPLMNG